MAPRNGQGQHHRVDPRVTVTKWVILGSPFACALGYVLLK